MDVTNLKYTEFPMDSVAEGVHEILKEFINREAQYIYSSYDKRKLFSLKDKEDYLHNSVLSVEEYIVEHNLEYKWKRENIRENMSYRQQKRFEKSKMTLDEYIDANDLYTATITNDNESSEFYIYNSDDYEYDDDNDDYSDDGWGD
jgi:hypothetical protein